MAERDRPTANGTVDWRSLPDFAPDVGLWSRVLDAQQRRRRIRWRRRGVFALAGAALATAAVVWRPEPAHLMHGDIAASQLESRRLESQWRQLAIRRSPDAAIATRMRDIDAALQTAYDRGGATSELAPLWRQRNQVLRGMISRIRNAKDGAESVVVRI
ncbi:MAG: hypothetical protein ACRETD_11650 [Steroidobacteraceae bacterium]